LNFGSNGWQFISEGVFLIVSFQHFLLVWVYTCEGKVIVACFIVDVI